MDSKTLRSGQCPACDSKEVYCDDNYSKIRDRINIKVTLWKVTTAPVQTYVCAACGYIERYISTESHMDFIKSNWRHVGDKEKRKRGE